MHTDLVGASGFKVHLNQGGWPECLLRFVVGDGFSPVLYHRKPPFTAWVPSNRGVDSSSQRVGQSLH